MLELMKDERLRLGAIVLGIVFSIAFVSYSIGVYVGNRSTLEQCTQEMNPLKLEIADLKKQLKRSTRR
jgi:cell division protein FtsB